MNEKLKLDFREFENENFHFSYLVWARKEDPKWDLKQIEKRRIQNRLISRKQLIQSQEFYPSGLGMAGLPQPP